MSVPTPTSTPISTPRLVKKATRLELGGSKTCLRFDSKTSFSWKIAKILSTSDTPDAKLLKILGETKLLFNSTSAIIVSSSFFISTSTSDAEVCKSLRDLKSDKREIVIGVGEPNHIAIPITYHFEKSDGTKERRFLGHVFVIGPDLAREGYLKEFLPGIESIANLLLAKLRGPTENKKVTAETPTDFFSAVSHEIRTPLYGIVGTTSLLGETIPLTAQQISYLSTLTSHSQHLLGMVNNILDFGKISSGKLVLSKTPTDIRTVLKTAATIIESRAASKNLTIVTDVAENIPSSLMLDSQRVTQILSNLLSNAVKFTEKGGVTVKIRGTEVPRGEPDSRTGSPFASQTNSPVQAETKGLRLSTGKNSLVARFQSTRTQSDTILGVGSKKPGDRSSLRVDPTEVKKSRETTSAIIPRWRLDISVEDTGVGISPEEIGNIKDVERADGSAGLGLSIVRCLVKMMGGEISVSSSGSGSTFSFFIFADVDPVFGLGSGVSATGSKINFFAGPKNNDVAHISSPARPSSSPSGERFLSSKSAPGAVSSKKEKRSGSRKKSELKILIAEDDDVKAFTLQEMFFHLGYSPEKIQIVSGAGDDCVTEAERSRYDIIFMDSATGARVMIEKIRALPPRSRSRPAPKIVVLSHPDSRSGIAATSFAAEADRVLIKPVTKEKLAAVMESFFGVLM